MWKSVEYWIFFRHAPYITDMGTVFNEKRATQAAARLLRLLGGETAYIKLLKLLYLADRRALAALGQSITCDCYVSMKNGPVLSNTYNLLAMPPEPGEDSYWHSIVSAPSNYDVRLLDSTPASDALSRAQEQIIDDVFAKFGHMGKWVLCEYTHTLREWKHPGASAWPISIREILEAQDVSAQDVDEIEASLQEAQEFDSIFGP